MNENQGEESRQIIRAKKGTFFVKLEIIFSLPYIQEMRYFQLERWAVFNHIKGYSIKRDLAPLRFVLEKLKPFGKMVAVGWRKSNKLRSNLSQKCPLLKTQRANVR